MKMIDKREMQKILCQHRVYYINLASYETLEKKKKIVIMKPDKGNGVVILDRKVYDFRHF